MTAAKCSPGTSSVVARLRSARSAAGRHCSWPSARSISSPPNGICSSGTPVAAAMALRFSMLDGGSRDLRVLSETSSCWAAASSRFLVAWPSKASKRSSLSASESSFSSAERAAACSCACSQPAAVH